MPNVCKVIRTLTIVCFYILIEKGQSAVNDILTLVGDRLARDWKSFLRHSAILEPDVLQSKVDDIQHRHPTELRECGHEAVITWYRCRRASATYDCLIAVLEKAQLQMLSGMLWTHSFDFHIICIHLMSSTNSDYVWFIGHH